MTVATHVPFQTHTHASIAYFSLCSDMYIHTNKNRLLDKDNSSSPAVPYNLFWLCQALAYEVALIKLRK
jgi:hypothetical protein